MSDGRRDVWVGCWNCHKRFPVGPAATDGEKQHAGAIVKRGEGTIRVARCCPFGESTNMLDLTCEHLEEKGYDVAFQRDLPSMLGGVPKEWEKIG